MTSFNPYNVFCWLLIFFCSLPHDDAGTRWVPSGIGQAPWPGLSPSSDIPQQTPHMYPPYPVLPRLAAVTHSAAGRWATGGSCHVRTPENMHFIHICDVAWFGGSLEIDRINEFNPLFYCTLFLMFCFLGLGDRPNIVNSFRTFIAHFVLNSRFQPLN